MVCQIDDTIYIKKVKFEKRFMVQLLLQVTIIWETDCSSRWAHGLTRYLGVVVNGGGGDLSIRRLIGLEKSTNHNCPPAQFKAHARSARPYSCLFFCFIAHFYLSSLHKW